MKTKRSTECAVLMGLGACHGCASGSNLAFHVDFRPHKFIAHGFFAEDNLSLWVFAPFAPSGPLIWVHVTMLQVTSYVLHFKRVLDSGEGQAQIY